MKRIILFILLVATHIVDYAQTHSLSKPSSTQSVFLNSNPAYGETQAWRLQKAADVGADGTEISSLSYQDKDWMDAVIPGTVLTSLVANKAYPDPYFGDLNKRSKKIIPDMADVGKEFYHYWFRTTFTVPESFTGKRLWLKLHGINYRAEIWMNGRKLGDMAGMFNSAQFDITSIADRKGKNTLAVNVLPIDVPGQSGLKTERRTGAQGENHNGGDGLIGENVTMLMSAGWDFTFPDGVRDRNTGIWREVELFATDEVILEHPFVISKIPLPDTSSSRQTVSVEVTNHSNSRQNGTLKGTISPGNTIFEKTISLLPHEAKTITFDPEEYKQLIIQDPKLWWPINKGEQNLYQLDLSFIQDKKVGHSISTRFGIREITSDQHTPDSSRRFLVNGYPIFVRGTNWIPDAMLRNSLKRTHAELTYTKQAGLNFIRFWGGGIAESDYFFELCDEMGFLVWNEYWMTGDTRYPTDTALYLKNIESTVKRIRNHASLAYHVSSNESTEMPGARELIAKLDPTRGYQMQSECCGVHDGSPYKYENPMQYFENTASQRGSRVDGFNPEYGTPCLPTIESLREMMDEKDLWPINDSVWNYLDGGGFHQITTKYREAVDMFGKSNSITEFAKKAQFVGALNYRAIWEVWNYNKFAYGDRFASGFLFWYHNSPMRQTGGRMYDWSLEPTAALYYSQNGLQPLHPQYDYLKKSVSVYNDYRKSFRNYSVTATLYNIHSEKVSEKAAVIDIPSDGLVKDALFLEFPNDLSQVHFIKLALKDTDGKLVSESFYWQSKDDYHGAWTMTGPAVSGFEEMNKLEKVRLNSAIRLDGEVVTVEVKNPSKTLSFFTQLKLQDEKGKSIRPAFYSDNFFCLLPGESKTVTIQFTTADVPNKVIKIITDGFNAVEQAQTLTLN
ncbi:glycoside hydrolase family 2 protein [Olivibacter sitiensis]|uniref:glycoside hydrolase family 2 protein n=1 Tax=Olivibacter sitiensis TaxID=376470 RepID=UPI00040E535F|nr:sugar-binding domain-containing protein [Olivibacter sitiensis]